MLASNSATETVVRPRRQVAYQAASVTAARGQVR